MKNTALKTVILLFVLTNICQAQAGKSTDEFKKLINITFKNGQLQNQFKGWKEESSSLISDPKSSYNHVVTVYKRALVYIAVYTIGDEKEPNHKIKDIIEVKNVKPGWGLYAGVCKENEVKSSGIVAYVKITLTDYTKNILQAWQTDTTKLEFVPKNIKGIACMNEILRK
jgi:hypothetical protein